MKKVLAVFPAYTRQTHDVYLSFPEDYTEAQILREIELYGDSMDENDEYVEDPHYWEEGEPYFLPVPDEEGSL